MRIGRDQEWLRKNTCRSQSLSWKARLTCRTSVFCLCLHFLCCSFSFSPGLPLICVQRTPIGWLFLSQKTNSFSLRCLDLMCHAPQRVCSKKNPVVFCLFVCLFLRLTMVQSTCRRVAEGRWLTSLSALVRWMFLVPYWVIHTERSPLLHLYVDWSFRISPWGNILGKIVFGATSIWKLVIILYHKH